MLYPAVPCSWGQAETGLLSRTRKVALGYQGKNQDQLILRLKNDEDSDL